MNGMDSLPLSTNKSTNYAITHSIQTDHTTDFYLFVFFLVCPFAFQFLSMLSIEPPPCTVSDPIYCQFRKKKNIWNKQIPIINGNIKSIEPFILNFLRINKSCFVWWTFWPLRLLINITLKVEEDVISTQKNALYLLFYQRIKGTWIFGSHCELMLQAMKSTPQFKCVICFSFFSLSLFRTWRSGEIISSHSQTYIKEEKIDWRKNLVPIYSCKYRFVIVSINYQLLWFVGSFQLSLVL